MNNDGMRRAKPSRRDVIVAGGASAIALTAGTGVVEKPAVASGFVFEDRSGTGQRQRGDPGVAGVLISNGCDVVTTGADGHWVLPVADGDSLFVIKPPHWSTPAGPGGVPRFSYLHQPHGTPRDILYRHEGVAPTSELPPSIDFPLRRHYESATFEALLLADTQPANSAELEYLRDDIIVSALSRAAAFGINHGDVVFDDLSLYPRYLKVLSATGIPWHHCPGNHDLNSEAADDRYAKETWKRIFGPRHYAFQYAGATFILLDNVYYYGNNPGMSQSGRYCGLIGNRQLQFVANVMKHVPPEQLLVVSMHIPLQTYQDPTNSADNTVDRNLLLELLHSRPHAVSFSGHMHLTEHHYLSTEDGLPRHGPHHHHVLTAASGGWWGGPHDCRGIPSADSQDGTPNGFHILSVDGSQYTTRFVAGANKGIGSLRALVDSPHRREADAAGGGSLLGGPIAADELQHCELVVNVFDGGPRTRATYEIAGQGSRQVPMQRTATYDPYVAKLFERHVATQKSWVRALPSSHLWKAPLPANLEPGAHRVTVRAIDEYERALVGHIVLEVKS
jgi:C terminal of Calcineurin-like phosphoesterase/Calcineurin-like phosphoesterase